jgi:hypothetical protein
MPQPIFSRRPRSDRRPRRRLRVGLAVAGLTLASATAVLTDEGVLSGGDNPWPYASVGRSPVLAAVGDIACQPGSPVEKEKASDVCSATPLQAQSATADQIEAMQPNLVAILGDEQCQVGRYQDFLGSFDTTYGAFKFLQRPSPGNHEFYSLHGETGVHGDGYFDYYNGYQHNPADGSAVTDTFTDVRARGASRSRGRARAGRPGSSARPETVGTPTTSAPGTSSR